MALCCRGSSTLTTLLGITLMKTHLCSHSRSNPLRGLHAHDSRLLYPSKSRVEAAMLLVLLGHSKSCTMAQWNGQGAWQWSADWRSQCEVSRQQRPPPLKPLCPVSPYTLLSTFHGEGSPGNLRSAFRVILPLFCWITPSFCWDGQSILISLSNLATLFMFSPKQASFYSFSYR